MIESFVLGAIQGITEWLPISSEGMIVLAKVNLFPESLEMADLISYALFLHLGTFFAALIYFKKEVAFLLKSSFRYRESAPEVKKQLNFYLLATLFSALVGGAFLFFLSQTEKMGLTGKGITLLVGVMLWVTAFLQLKKKEKGKRSFVDLKAFDGLLLGLVQGLSIMPGLSRSGITVSALLLRKFEESRALKMSFIMSLPVVLGGNIALNLDKLNFSPEALTALLLSFLFGILTIHILLKIAGKLNFGLFVCFFGILIALSLLI